MNRILVVNNNPKLAKNLSNLLKERGYEYYICNTGKATLMELGRTVTEEEVPLYNLIIMDMGGLDDTTGSALVAFIRDHYKDEGIRMLVAHRFLRPKFQERADEVYKLIYGQYGSIPMFGTSKRAGRKAWPKRKIDRVIDVTEEKIVDEDALFKAIEESLRTK